MNKNIIQYGELTHQKLENSWITVLFKDDRIQINIDRFYGSRDLAKYEMYVEFINDNLCNKIKSFGIDIDPNKLIGIGNIKNYKICEENIIFVWDLNDKRIEENDKIYFKIVFILDGDLYEYHQTKPYSFVYNKTEVDIH